MATLATIKGRVLVQIGDNEPIEVGTIEVPIDIVTGPSKKPGYRGATRGIAGGVAQ